MLEFLGFIALIAIIFGVSFTSALTGFLKVVAIGFAVIMALGIIAKMLESKTGAWLVLVGSALAIYVGVTGINTDRLLPDRVCSSTIGTQFFADCLLENDKIVNEKINQGWWYAICGGIVATSSYISLSDIYKKEKQKTNTPKTHSAV